MRSFKQSFKKAVDRVREAYPAVNVIVSDECGVTLFPSRTLVPTMAQTQASEVMSKQSKRKLSEDDISNVLEHIDYGDDSLAARRHVVHGLFAGYTGRNIIDVWNCRRTLLEPL